MSDKRPLIYILGPSYSGSTLLTFLLARHPDVATIGELKGTSMGDVSGYQCSCGAMIEDCGFWQDVTARMDAKGRVFSVARFGTHFRDGGLAAAIVGTEMRGPAFEVIRRVALRLPGAQAHLKAVMAQNVAMVETVCELLQKPVFLDGSKDAIRLNHFVEADCFDLRVIRLERDGRGVSLSYKRHHDCGFEAGVREWVLTQEHSDAVEAQCSGITVKRVRYEDLCSDTDAVLADIQQAMGLQPVDLMGLQPDADALHIVGNDMRLSPPTALRLDEKWRRQLDDDQLALFKRRAGATNRSLGYE